MQCVNAEEVDLLETLLERRFDSSLLISSLSSLWTPLPEGMIHSISNIFHPCSELPPVIMVHGLIMSSEYMVPTAQQLASLCRVYALDFPGFGKSYKPNTALTLPQLADVLARWMDKLSIDKGQFVGNSFGCQIIAEFAVRHADRVERIVMQGPTVDMRARNFTNQFIKLLINALREPQSLRILALKNYLNAGLKRAIGTINIALKDRIEEKLPHIRQPTLIVSGNKDPLVPTRWAEEVTALLPNGCLRLLPGLPHTINYSAPLEFARVIKPFLLLDRS